MTLVEKIAFESEGLHPQKQQQVLDFVEFLKQKERRELEADMRQVVEQYLPAWKELAR